VPANAAVTTFLFTDIEGSSRLWEEQPERMQRALEHHDAVVRGAVLSRHGNVVKMLGDGVHAAFEDPYDALCAALEVQRGLQASRSSSELSLSVRCGLHSGIEQRRDNDFFGPAVNRAARIAAAAHGGQVLVSHFTAQLLGGRLPEGANLIALGSIRFRDLAAPERVHQVTHPELRREFPALRALLATPHNLTPSITSFIGRDRERAEIRALLAQSRLLTLLGPGGIGKTRLVVQVAAELMSDYPDGVWFVDLAPVSDARMVVQTVASTLGVKEEAGRSLTEVLLRYAVDRNMLLILDNCEHLIGACAGLARLLLQGARGIHILASSRENLHLAAEQVYPVPGLAVPGPELASLPAERARDFEAVALFCERASAAQPSFQLSERNVRTVIEICRNVDGLPLAIELAAARVRALSVETIHARLNDRLRLLVRGEHGAPPRQQTLRALIDWGYELLSDVERVVLRRLALFVDGFTLEAAEAVARSESTENADVLDLLSRLVEKSLVVFELERERYRLLETVREYARERLELAGEVALVRGRHLEFFVALAEKAWPELIGPDQSAWFTRLDAERENLLFAHTICDGARERVLAGLRLVHLLKLYWISRGLLELGYRLTNEALARLEPEIGGLERGRALTTAGQFAMMIGRHEEARVHLERALVLAEESRDDQRIADVLQPLGLGCLYLGDLAASRRHLEKALKLESALGESRYLVAALAAIVQLCRIEGAVDAAREACQRALELARTMGDRESTAIALLNLAMISIEQGQLSEAQSMVREAYAISDEIGGQPAEQSVLEVSAGLAACSGDWSRAARLYGAAEAHASRIGLRRDPADEAFLAPLVARARQALGTLGFAALESAGRALPNEDVMLEVGAWLEGGVTTGAPPADSPLGVVARAGPHITDVPD
jgi:predicted ATPase/class 3 adenylate cyclase